MARIALCILISSLAFACGDDDDGNLEIYTMQGEVNGWNANPLCVNVAPGLNRFRRGLDITKLDFLSLELTADDGVRGPIVDYTCTQGKKVYIRNPGGDAREYDLPDQVWDITAVPGGMLDSHIDIFKTRREVRKKMAAEAGVDFISGVFSASASYTKISNSLRNESKYIESVKSFVSSSRADLAPFWSLTISQYASDFIEKLLPKTFEEGPEKYSEFIRYFGTHYFANGKFGGVIHLQLETDKSYFLGKTESDVSAQAKGLFLNILKANGGYKGGPVKIDENFIAKTSKSIRYHGGDTNLLDNEGLKKWQPTVAENPWIFGGRLEQITKLFTDQAKRKAMERAVLVHLDRAKLEDAQKLIYAKIKSWPKSEQQLRSLLVQSKKLISLRTPGHDDVSALCDKIEEDLLVPSWFLDDVKLCFQWNGNGGQCGGGVPKNLCASPNQFTQNYRDDSDDRRGGCQMSWGIKTYASTPSWFAQMRMVYQWYPDGDGGQCGGGAARFLSAVVGGFTPFYRDDSDGRGGGCRMRWALQYPTTTASPLWAQNLLLCFQWYPDGDGGQCGGGVARKICTRMNDGNNTPYYRDDTDNRRGGCQMSWAIKTT